MTRMISGRRGGIIASAATAGLASVVVLGMSVGYTGGGAMSSLPPNATTSTPPADSTPTTATAAHPSTPARHPAPRQTHPQLGRSPATAVTIAGLGIRTSLVQLGTAKDKSTIQLPPATRAGWFRLSASPGQPGITILIGYIRRSSSEPGAFARLPALRPGQPITVRRADGRTAVYKATAIAYYPRGKLPAATVYKRTTPSELRLITCGGSLRPNQPPGNAVITAHLTAVR